MPSTILPPSRNHRLEVKYNVITEFPHLGLHSASASGDIGLVQYAISHGQPVNSVLDGVLPLHAACAGGNVLVVNFLIENGADVNAPRLPRRYSDRSRDAVAPIVGTSGSTPLHFAAANGHLNVIRILLSHGAAPDRADKHGMSPEIIARQNGWIECAEVLARAASTVKGGTSGPLDNLEALRKRLHFKCSSDQILPSAGAASDPESKVPQSDMESRPLYSHSGGNPSQVSTQTMPQLPSGRRPSLPQVFDDSSIKPPSQPNRSNRPRSAGTGAESRKLHSKLSLLSLFKKSNADGSSSSVASASDAHVPSPPPSQPVPLTTSPAHVPNALPVSPRSTPIPISSSPRDPSHLESQRRRLESSASLTSVRAYPLHPADIHTAIARSRNHSMSGASNVSVGDDEAGSADSISGVPVRSGILRMHNRSISGQGSISQPSSLPRTIRFERSASESTFLSGRTRSPGARGQLENRMRFLGISSGEDEHDRIPDTIEESPVIPYAAPPVFVNIITDNDDDLDEEYGIPLRDPELHAVKARSATNALPFSINVPPPTDDVLTESRLRGDSISSSSTATTSTYPRTSSSDATSSMGAASVTPHPPGSPPMSPISTEVEVGAEETRDPHQRHRKIPAPLEVDIKTISSHAQAEELVQRTQQSILNMEEHLDQHVKKDSETGRTPLSAKLAAYGESLAIERLLKEQEQTPPEYGSRINGGISLLSATKPSSLYPMFASGHSGSSSESASQELQFEHVRQTTWPSSYEEPRGIPCSPPRALIHPGPRSRTPDIDSEPASPFTGVPLSRVSTAPSYDSESASTHRGRQRDPSRSVQKLTRMGFSTFDSWHPLPLKGRASRSPPPSLRFGLRTIMQSFQGK